MAIADAILRQIQQAGQPRTIKSTETVTGKEPVDIGGLGLLLYMLMQGMGKGPTETLGVTPIPPPGLGVPPIPGSFGASGGGGDFGAMDPMQLIMSLLGGGAGLAGAPGLPRAPGLGGFGGFG